MRRAAEEHLSKGSLRAAGPSRFPPPRDPRLATALAYGGPVTHVHDKMGMPGSPPSLLMVDLSQNKYTGGTFVSTTLDRKVAKSHSGLHFELF